MSVKAVLILCAQALLVKSALSQCTSRAAVSDVSGFAGPRGFATPYGFSSPGLAYNGRWAGNDQAYNGLSTGCAGNSLAYDGIYAPAMEFTATSGGALPISSASAIAPVGISVMSDNVYEGALTVGGELPFVGTVAMEGVVPSAGAGAVNHACGNGRNAMISETSAFAPAAYGTAAPAAFGYRGGLGDLAYPAGAGFSGALAPAGFASPGLGYRGGCANNFGYAI